MHFLVVAVFAFFAGYFYADSKKRISFKKTFTPKRVDCEAERIQQEYNNFLNYDGSEQL